MNYVCASCAVEMRCDKNEVTVEDARSLKRTLVSGDRWKCPGCG